MACSLNLTFLKLLKMKKKRLKDRLNKKEAKHMFQRLLGFIAVFTILLLAFGSSGPTLNKGLEWLITSWIAFMVSIGFGVLIRKYLPGFFERFFIVINVMGFYMSIFAFLLMTFTVKFWLFGGA